MSFWVPSVFFVKKMGEIYSTASGVHSTTTSFSRSLFNSSWIKGWFLGISNPEHPTRKGHSSNASFIPWTVWSSSWSEVIFSQAEIFWDRHPAIKWLMHWYRYSLCQGRYSRNILTMNAYFLNICVTSCWWYIWCCWMAVLDADGPFYGPGSLNNEKQKIWCQHHYLCTQKNA